MDYVRFGRSSLKVSRLSLGAMGFGTRDWREWVLDESRSRAIVRRALDAGINLFDTCNFYSIGASERILGKVLLDFVPREEVLIATKVGNPMAKYPNAGGFSRKHVFDAMDASLERLGTDHVDLYQTHVWDPETDLEELVEAFGDLVRAGKARYIGVTTIPAWSLAKTLCIAGAKHAPRFASVQCEYNLCHREAERELMPLARAEGLALIPFSPLARGFLCADRRESGNETARTASDSYTRKFYYRDGDFAVLETLQGIARQRDLTPAQVAMAWVLRQPAMTSPIFGATRPEHVDEAVAALEVALSEDEADALESVYQPRPPSGGGH